MSHSYRVFGILALVVASLLATAPPAAAASATNKNFTLPAVTKTTYSISGKVIDTGSAGVADVGVVVESPSGSLVVNGWATTGTSGTYTISNLTPGSYTLHFYPPREMNLQSGYRNINANGYFSASTPTPVTITTASLTNQNVRLPAGYKIYGTVFRSDGITPIAGVDVTAMNTNGSWGDDFVTGTNGNYMLMGLSPGFYRVSFDHQYYPLALTNQPVSDTIVPSQTGCWYTTPLSKFSASCLNHSDVVIGSTNVYGISPKIPDALTITGLVMTRASNPIVGAWVQAIGYEGSGAQTDVNGRYTITGLNPGPYKIQVNGPYLSRVPNGYYTATGAYHWTTQTASASPVTISQHTTPLLDIKPPTGYFITGKITDTAGSPLSDVYVQAVGGAGTAAENPETWTDVNGDYSIGPVPAGNTYQIKANGPYSGGWGTHKVNAHPSASDPSLLQAGWYLNGVTNNFTTAKSSATLISVIGADWHLNNMGLPMGSSISGKVTLTGGSACSFCEVDALTSAGVMVASTETSGTGMYTLQGLSDGSYKVKAVAVFGAISATSVQLITSGFYRSGFPGNFWTTLAGATPIAVSYP